MRNKWIIIFFIGLMSCKTTQTTTTKTHKIEGETIRHRTEVKTLPTKTLTIIPCKESNQEFNIGETIIKWKIKNDTVRIETETAPSRQVLDSIATSQREIYESQEEKVITRFRVPRWAWVYMGVSTALLAWAYRRKLRYLL